MQWRGKDGGTIYEGPRTRVTGPINPQIEYGKLPEMPRNFVAT